MIMSFGSSAILLLRPVAFRPVLTDGLALSGFSLNYFVAPLFPLVQSRCGIVGDILFTKSISSIIHVSALSGICAFADGTITSDE